MNKKANFFIIALFLTNCQTKETYINNVGKLTDKKQITAAKSDKKFEIDNQPTLLSLKNTHWIFDNYEDKIDLKNLKVPTITFTETDKTGIKFKGDTFINFHQGKLNINVLGEKFLNKTSYKLTTLISLNKKIDYYEFRYVKDFKKINSLKIYSDKLVFGVEGLMNFMIFKKLADDKKIK